MCTWVGCGHSSFPENPIVFQELLLQRFFLPPKSLLELLPNPVLLQSPACWTRIKHKVPTWPILNSESISEVNFLWLPLLFHGKASVKADQLIRILISAIRKQVTGFRITSFAMRGFCVAKTSPKHLLSSMKIKLVIFFSPGTKDIINLTVLCFACPFICSLCGSSLYCIYSTLRTASIHGEIAQTMLLHYTTSTQTAISGVSSLLCCSSYQVYKVHPPACAQHHLNQTNRLTYFLRSYCLALAEVEGYFYCSPTKQKLLHGSQHIIVF